MKSDFGEKQQRAQTNLWVPNAKIMLSVGSLRENRNSRPANQIWTNSIPFHSCFIQLVALRCEPNMFAVKIPITLWTLQPLIFPHRKFPLLVLYFRWLQSASNIWDELANWRQSNTCWCKQNTFSSTSCLQWNYRSLFAAWGSTMTWKLISGSSKYFQCNYLKIRCELKTEIVKHSPAASTIEFCRCIEPSCATPSSLRISIRNRLIDILPSRGLPFRFVSISFDGLAS